jgi:hypothetical protein
VANKQGFKRPSDFVAAMQKEAVKQHFVYDGLDRMTQHYMAPVDADDGDTALLTEYTYRPDPSTQVLAVKESLSTWDSSWDI